MKKVLLSVIAIGAVISSAISQRAETFKYGLEQRAMTYTGSKAERPINNNQFNQKIFQTLIWDDDFDLTDIKWTAVTQGQGQWDFGVDDDPYIIENYPNFFGTMQSTTASNGFAFFDGVEYLVNEDVDAQDAWIELTDALDFSAYESVMFTFEQRYIAFNSDVTWVEVSLDNGATWEQGVDVNASVEANNDPALQDTIIERFEVNNSSEVKFRFRWENTSTDDAFGSGYAWLVDDVRIYELPDHDIELVRAPWGTSMVQVFSNVDAMPIDSRNIPEQQISQIDFYADLYNLGAQDQTDVTYSIDVNNGDYNDNVIQPLIESTDTASLMLGYTPSGVGTFNVDRMVEAADVDENPSNNQFSTETIEVNNNFIYARDNGSDVFSFGINGEVVDFYMFYEIFEPQQLAFVRLGIAENSNEVSFVVNITDASDGTEVGASQLIVMDGDDLDSEMIIPVTDFNGNYLTLDPGLYEVKVETQEPDLRLSGGGSINQATAFFEIKSGPDAGAFGSFSNAPRIRLDFDPTVSIQDEEFNESNLVLYPNPASENANLEFELSNKSEVRIDVVDITGKQVYSENMNTLNSGNQKVQINTSNFNEGVYFVTLSSEGTKTTKKLVVKK